MWLVKKVEMLGAPPKPFYPFHLCAIGRAVNH